MYQKRFGVDVNRSISNNSTPISNRKSLNKKGQVTIFIIIGIIILLAVSLIIALQTEVIKFKPGEIIPTEKGKVESFITSCMDKIGNDALLQIGLQSGYIYVSDSIAADANQHLRISPMNVIPYWAYGQNTNIPSMNQIKRDLDDYMQANLRSCLFGTQAFQESYDLIEKTSITADTIIQGTKVQFNAHWDVEIRNKEGDVITELIDHTYESPVKLKSVYDMAVRVVEKEMETLQLEIITQDLIALEHPNLPVAGFEMSCSEKQWDVSKAKQTMKDLLHINIPQLKIKGTEYVQFPEELTYYQNHYIWDIGEEYQNPQISVNFQYDQTYPFYFYVTPLSGSKMKSSQLGGSQYLKFLCMQNWKFTYDVVYPVLVHVRDDSTGYVFTTGMTVHLLRNMPNRGQASARPSYFVQTATDDKYCARRTVPMTVYTYEQVENNETGVSFREPLDGVNITFSCLRFKCDIGETKYGFSNRGDISGLTTNYPYCVGGILRGVKNGYQENWIRVVTSNGKENELNMIPLFEFPTNKIRLLKHNFKGPQDVGFGTKLSQNEMAMIKITSINKNELGEIMHEDTALSTLILSANITEEDRLSFLAKADFAYKVEINLFNEENFVGGYMGVWNVPWAQLKNAQQITFHVITTDASNDEEVYPFQLAMEDNSQYAPKPEIR